MCIKGEESLFSVSTGDVVSKGLQHVSSWTHLSQSVDEWFVWCIILCHSAWDFVVLWLLICISEGIEPCSSSSAIISSKSQSKVCVLCDTHSEASCSQVLALLGYCAESSKQLKSSSSSCWLTRRVPKEESMVRFCYTASLNTCFASGINLIAACSPSIHAMCKLMLSTLADPCQLAGLMWLNFELISIVVSFVITGSPKC